MSRRASPRAARQELVARRPVDQKLARVETVDEICARVEPRLARFGAARLLLVPDCGFATFSDNPITAPEIAEAKLGALARAAVHLRGSERSPS